MVIGHEKYKFTVYTLGDSLIIRTLLVKPMTVDMMFGFRVDDLSEALNRDKNSIITHNKIVITSNSISDNNALFMRIKRVGDTIDISINDGVNGVIVSSVTLTPIEVKQFLRVFEV